MAELKYLKLELGTIQSQIFVLDTSMALKAIYRSSAFGGLAHHSADWGWRGDAFQLIACL